MVEKIISVDKAAKEVAKLKLEGKKVVLCHGVFDVLHPGHVRHLKTARNHGDILLVSVTPDKYVNRGPGRPIFQQELRAEVLASLAHVNYVVINEWPTAVETIRRIKPTFYVKGNDYSDRSKDVTGGIYEEEQAVKDAGGRIIFTNDITFSSSSIANNLFNVYPKEAADFLQKIRENIKEEDILARINGLNDTKVLVIGDAIIDEYHYCTPMGKSPKENIIVTRYQSEERFAGGVLAAANHVASLCNRVDLITCIGTENSHEDFIRSRLKQNVTPHLFPRKNSPTIVKRRFVEPSYFRKLFEICFMNGEHIAKEDESPLLNHLEKTIAEYDLVLVTDFGHGLMTPAIIDLVCRKSKFLALNVQSNSANMGFNLITKYPRADYICIDEPEARLALHDRTSDLQDIIRRLQSQLEARFVTITRGHHGCIVYCKNDGFVRIPALTNNVVDTVGAGDAFLSISSPCMAMGFPIEQAGLIGNAAGALKVGIVGNRNSVEKSPLLKFITTLLK